MTVSRFLIVAVLLVPCAQTPASAGRIDLEKPMLPPNWALLERQLLTAHTPACKEFFEKYFDERGFLLCVERWGGDDGPDDAPENVNGWPVLHALGGDDSILQMYKTVWEGHLRQYTLAKTVDVPFARDGMYYKEFPTKMDWLHNGEGLTVFNLQGLSDPYDVEFAKRVKRYAGFYMNEDPQAQNFDFEHQIIRSMFNGSRGPLLRKATGLDWAGDPIEVKGRFLPRHNEENYAQMVEHFKDYNDVIGDHPQNLLSTCLATNAYMLTGEVKYKKWLLDYVDAWVERTKQNNGIIPSNVGLDGVIGSSAGGKWYGGVYGWGFTVIVPQSRGLANRNTVDLGSAGFVNAHLLTGDSSYLDLWGDMIDTINSNKKVIDGKEMYPSMYGDDGWYGYSEGKYGGSAQIVYYMTMDRNHLKRLDTQNGWIGYLEGNNPDFPETVLRNDLGRIRGTVEGLRNDPTTPDTRLSDDPMVYNPATVGSLVNLMLGGPGPSGVGRLLQVRVRYFDPIKRRAGIPDDVAALVERLTADETVLTLVNVNQSESRDLVVQGGAYAEHQFESVSVDGKSTPVNDSKFTVRLQPGAGGRLVISTRRFANQPTLALPWDRD